MPSAKDVYNAFTTQQARQDIIIESNRNPRLATGHRLNGSKRKPSGNSSLLLSHWKELWLGSFRQLILFRYR